MPENIRQNTSQTFRVMLVSFGRVGIEGNKNRNRLLHRRTQAVEVVEMVAETIMMTAILALMVQMAAMAAMRDSQFLRVCRVSRIRMPERQINIVTEYYAQ